MTPATGTHRLADRIGETARPAAVVRARVQQILDELIAAGAPGALAQFRDGDGTWVGSSGVAELGGERPLAPDGWFRIGSVTKTFTAAAILQIVGEGRVGLEDTVDRWLPALIPGGDEITLRQLLDHTSGLYNYTDGLAPAAVLRNRTAHWTPEQVVALAARQKPRFRPGTSWEYWSSSRGEFHPPALTEPCLTVSRYTALLI